MASRFIEWAHNHPTRSTLRAVLARSDGHPWPFDFVDGPAAEEVNELVADLRDALG